ncbi:PT domain-containing protein, partial [Chloroflexota bacterium]
NGDCAVIEFLDGEMVCHSTTGEQNMPYKSITNATYEDSVSYLSQFEGFGGNDPIPDESADDKLSRFVQSVYWVQEYSGDSDPIDYAFDALDYVGQTGDVATRQKLAYDLQHLRVYFRTPENLNIRYFDLDSFDFSCETPVTMLDIKANLSGDVSGDFIVYDPEANHRQVENFCNYAFFQNPPEGLVDTISQYPESTEPIAEPTEEPIVEPTAEPTAEPTEAPVDEGDDDDSTPTGLIIGIAGFVLVLLSLGGYFLVIRRRGLA